MSLEDRLAELTRLGQEMGLESRVCLTHGKINVCRVGAREGGCVWSEDPADVNHIQAMHIRDAADGQHRPA